ncbi:hypothetical protein SNOUR_43095 [Streptomyces noursei ATCC 11455]|nr:hypothetical protein SNOUR_43095 [Streptomyces noursei ATCC 11455]
MLHRMSGARIRRHVAVSRLAKLGCLVSHGKFSALKRKTRLTEALRWESLANLLTQHTRSGARVNR